MNYDSIITEMLARIQKLEQKTAELEAKISLESGEKMPAVSTADIMAYIGTLLDAARAEGRQSVKIVARDVHNALALKKRYPMVCNAMRHCMKDGDRVVFSPASGYSSTVEIEYLL